MKLIWLLISIGGATGSYVPVMFGADGFSLWSIVGGFIGSLAGIWVYTKLDL